MDQRLTGGVIGLTLQTTPAEMYRAWIEATAFGARVIMERFEEYGQKVERIVNCGGISVKNPLVMQIYADIMGRPIAISRSAQTAALGSAIAGAVAAGAYPSFAEATDAMTALDPRVFQPNPDASGRLRQTVRAVPPPPRRLRRPRRVGRPVRCDEGASDDPGRGAPCLTCSFTNSKRPSTSPT